MNLAKLASIALTALALSSASGVASAEEKTSEGSSASTRGTVSKGGLEVRRLVFARGVDAHEPQEPASTFSAKEDRVYAFVELANPGAEDNIEVVFQPPAGAAFSVPLKVAGNAARFRTWAFTRRAHETGEWIVVVRAPGGKLLARQSFTITT